MARKSSRCTAGWYCTVPRGGAATALLKSGIFSCAKTPAGAALPRARLSCTRKGCGRCFCRNAAYRMCWGEVTSEARHIITRR